MYNLDFNKAKILASVFKTKEELEEFHFQQNITGKIHLKGIFKGRGSMVGSDIYENETLIRSCESI